MRRRDFKRAPLAANTSLLQISSPAETSLPWSSSYHLPTRLWRKTPVCPDNRHTSHLFTANQHVVNTSRQLTTISLESPLSAAGVQFISTPRIVRLSRRCAFIWQWWLYHFPGCDGPLSQSPPASESPLSGDFLSFLTPATTITRPRPS